MYSLLFAVKKINPYFGDPPPSLNTWLSQESWNLIFCELQLVINVEQGIITWPTFFKKSGVCHLSCGNIAQLVTCFINNNYIFP